MAIDGFLKIPDIDGESQRDGHEDEIEIHELAFAMTAPQSAWAPRKGRVVMRPITVRKHYDRSSPYLKKALADNLTSDEMTIAVRRTVHGRTSDYLVVVLSDASVVGYELSTTEDGLLEEELTLSYRGIRFVYDGDHEVELEA